MSLLPVDDAVARLLAGVEPLEPEAARLADAVGRVLAKDLPALRTQPPFPASAMDGYAVRSADARQGARLAVIGASRAGGRFAGSLGPGQAVRIFTGAPVPDGADAILIQEDATPAGDAIMVREAVAPGQYLRPAGLDFVGGDTPLKAGRTLDSRAVSLAAAMGYAALPVRRRPRVALLANGDELVPPGAETGPDQIVSSNGVGLFAMVKEFGGEPIDLGIAPDRQAAIGDAVDRSAGCDILVIIGGASVGDHDLVQATLTAKGMHLDFWRIAMRPGKPLMVGNLGGMRVLGFPGNPVSALVCGQVFLQPLVAAMLGRPTDQRLAQATLGADMGSNDNRQDYVRARLERVEGEQVATPFAKQDSSMLATLVAADALIIRPAGAPRARAGERVTVLLLDR